MAALCFLSRRFCNPPRIAKRPAWAAFRLTFIMSFVIVSSISARADNGAGDTGDGLTVEQARATVLEGCIDAGGSDGSCTCYVDTLRDSLPQKSYEQMMILAAYAMAGDDDEGVAYMTRHGMTGAQFLPMMLEWQEAVTRSSQKCGL